MAVASQKLSTEPSVIQAARTQSLSPMPKTGWRATSAVPYYPGIGAVLAALGHQGEILDDQIEHAAGQGMEQHETEHPKGYQ